jgi:hypothetical protein
LERFAMSAAIDFDPRAAAILRMLIYPIQFEPVQLQPNQSEPGPFDGIERVVEQVVFAEHLKLSVRDAIAAIDAGLASHARLSELIPQPHSEPAIRSFLSSMRTRLESEQGKV